MCNDEGNSKAAPSPLPVRAWQARRAGREDAEASAMKARGASRHRRLDEQHERAVRHRLRRPKPWKRRNASAETRRTVHPASRISSTPQKSISTKSASRGGAEAESRLRVLPQFRQNATASDPASPDTRRPANHRGPSKPTAEESASPEGWAPGDDQSPVLRDQIRLPRRSRNCRPPACSSQGRCRFPCR